MLTADSNVTSGVALEYIKNTSVLCAPTVVQIFLQLYWKYWWTYAAYGFRTKLSPLFWIFLQEVKHWATSQTSTL